MSTCPYIYLPCSLFMSLRERRGAPFRRAGGSDSISGKGFPPFFAAINRAIKIIYFVPSCFTA